MPDVWHPVSEEPPVGLVPEFYFVWRPEHEYHPEIAEFDLLRGWLMYGREIDGVTHWAEIHYPPAPEEA